MGRCPQDVRLAEEAPEVFGAWSDQVFGWVGPGVFRVDASLLAIFASAFFFLCKATLQPSWMGPLARG